MIIIPLRRKIIELIQQNIPAIKSIVGLNEVPSKTPALILNYPDVDYSTLLGNIRDFVYTFECYLIKQLNISMDKTIEELIPIMENLIEYFHNNPTLDFMYEDYEQVVFTKIPNKVSVGGLTLEANGYPYEFVGFKFTIIIQTMRV